MAHRATPPRWLPKWEADGWIGVANSRPLREVVALLRARSAPTTFQWVKGHSRVRGNDEADRLAGEGAEQAAPYGPTHAPPPTHFLRQGASLASLTQRIAYRGIMERKKYEPSRKAVLNVDRAVKAIREVTGDLHTPQALWKALRKDPVERRVRDFLWKATHGAYKVGGFWRNVPGYEARAQCDVCGVEDDLCHILTKCTAPGRAEMWALAKALLERRKIRVPETPTLGLFLGSPLLDLKNEEGKARPGASRLAKIVLSETAHSIWKLRCERVIAWEGQHKTHDAVVVDRTWHAAMDSRLLLDQQMTKKALAGGRVMDADVVLRTWAGVVGRAGGLPEDWVDLAGVLVGRQIHDLEPHTVAGRPRA
ncbi:hypothetical protein GY45DRAFT_1322330 [Cubamyces sp. BRFM 1775]|nr:hypothetical protein GY45DRAFT_1322330 [Cubamyces sp. BRFM 1775]